MESSAFSLLEPAQSLVLGLGEFEPAVELPLRIGSCWMTGLVAVLELMAMLLLGLGQRLVGGPELALGIVIPGLGVAL